MTVSVIIPVFNCQDYIAEAIHSIANQTVRDVEIVVVDDGSTDSTLEVARREAAQDPRVIVITQSNTGMPGAARNTGIRACRGEFIAFLDADDIYEPDKIEQELAAFRDFPEVDVVFCDVARFWGPAPDKALPGVLKECKFVEAARDHLEPRGDARFLCKPSFYSFMTTRMAAIATMTVMIRRTALFAEPVWFPEDWVAGEDLDLWFRLGRRFRMAYVDRILSWYRQRPGSVMTSQEKAVIGAIKAHGTNLNRALDVLTPGEIVSLRRRVARYYFELAYVKYRQGSMRESRQALMGARGLAREEFSTVAYLKTYLPKSLVKLLVAARS